MTHFESELHSLKEQLLGMASHAEHAVNQAIKALVERDDDIARRVKEDDDEIDRLEKLIDEHGAVSDSRCAGPTLPVERTACASVHIR